MSSNNFFLELLYTRKRLTLSQPGPKGPPCALKVTFKQIVSASWGCAEDVKIHMGKVLAECLELREH